MTDAPQSLVVVMGGDILVESVCRDLRAAGHRVTVIWELDEGLREGIEACGASCVVGSPKDPGALVEAGIESAVAFMALDQDDSLNIEVVLQARELNPNVRVVLRQFNRALARKIEQNLSNSSVISLAAHSAATYAAAAVEFESFLGIEFPKGSRSIVTFTRRTAASLGAAGCSVTQAEQRLRCRIVSRSGQGASEAPLRDDEELILIGPLNLFAGAPPQLRTTRDVLGWIAPRIRSIVGEFDPLLRLLLIAAIGVFVAATAFFGWALHLNPITAAYFVTETMTTVGYGDIALGDKGIPLQIAGIVLMSCGLIIANLAIAFVAAALVRAQWNAVQGLRPIHDAGHIIVFGAGRVGTRVVDYLCDLGALITVVELNPTPELLRRARVREISLLTGDGTLDDTLDLCNLSEARSTVVVTDKDATNLEIGFGSRVRHPGIPVIMRIAQPSYATAVRKHFEIRRTFSATALASGVIADLVDSVTARGRVSFGGRSYDIVEYPEGQVASTGGMLIAACAAKGQTRVVNNWSEVHRDDTVLVLVERPQ